LLDDKVLNQSFTFNSLKEKQEIWLETLVKTSA